MANQDPKELFLSTTPTRLFFSAALPGAVSMFASSLYDLLDGVLVGQLAGHTALAAMNLSMPFVILLFAAGDLVGVGSSVPIAIALGAGEDERANNVFTCAVLALLVLGGALGAVMWVAAPAMMALMGAEGELAEQAVVILRTYAACAAVSSMMFAVDNFFRLCGKIGHSLALNLAMAATGAVLEVVFIVFLHMGIFGAALGYSLAMVICVVVGMVPFALGRHKLRFVKPHFTADLIGEIVTAGSPAFLNNVAGRVTQVMFNASLLALGGEDAVAVYGIVMYTTGIWFSFTYGIGDALQPSVGYNLGAGRPDRVLALEKRIFASIIVLSLGTMALMALFPTQLTALFMANAPEHIVELARPAFRFVSIAYLVRWLPMCTQMFFTAVEKPKRASVLSVVIVLIAPLSMLFLLQPLGLTGLWLNLAGASVVSSIVAGVMLVGLVRELRAPGGENGRARL